MKEDLRYLLAWLLWCYDQGYVTHEDRAILDNWMNDDPATLTEDDVAAREGLLAMADEIIADLQEAGFALVREGQELPLLRLTPSPDVLP